MHKRNRTPQDKINDALDMKIQHLHPDTRSQMERELLNRPDISTNVVKCKSYVVQRLQLPVSGSGTLSYWVQRGWPLEVAEYRAAQSRPPTKSPSPFSREFWTQQINPNTGLPYTDTEADVERNARRPIRKEYWLRLGCDEETAIQKAQEHKQNNNRRGATTTRTPEQCRSTSHRCVEYWLLRGYSEDDARQKVAERQTTFSLDICVKKYGQADGLRRWAERQEKWHKSFKKQNYSKISQELFWKIAKHLSSLDDVYFAQLDIMKNVDTSGSNHELRLKLDRVVLPDFIDVRQKKIIEFDGSYWHGVVGRGNKRRDIERDAMYTKYGYTIMRVDERDFKSDPDGVVVKCLNFLTK